METVLNYLKELEINNNREWFAKTKKERAKATYIFEELVQALIAKIGEFEIQ